MDHFNTAHDHSFSFTVSAAVASVSIVLGELRAILEFGSSDEESELLAAIAEIAHNAVSAQPVGIQSPIEIAVYGRPPIVSITDYAGGFTEPPTRAVPAPDAVSGRGLLLARAFVPDMEIVPTSDGTTVKLPMRSTTDYRAPPPPQLSSFDANS